MLIVRHLSKSYGAIIVLDDISFVINPNDRVGIVGPNGVGKTTLLRIIMGLEKPGNGEVSIVDSARIGYLPQDPQMDLDKTVIETYRYGQVGYEGEFVGRLIGYGLFRLEDMHKKVGQLSIGQRRKLEIAWLMAEGPNVLLLDEPTNYISLDVLEAFEAAILSFQGPVIAVSHDRWFMQRFGGRYGNWWREESWKSDGREDIRTMGFYPLINRNNRSLQRQQQESFAIPRDLLHVLQQPPQFRTPLAIPGVGRELGDVVVDLFTGLHQCQVKLQ